MRFRNLRERENAIDLRLEIAFFQVVEHVLLCLGCQFCVGENLTHRVPADGQAFV